MSDRERPALFIDTVTFTDTHVHVSYAEPSEPGQVGRSIRLDIPLTDEVEDELHDVLDALLALIDKGELLRRNPPARIPSRRVDGP